MTQSKKRFCAVLSLSAAPGRTVSNRYKIRAFKTAVARDEFMQRPGNGFWEPTKESLPSGTYFIQYHSPGKLNWINIKELMV